jgi:hypothetical protein
LPSRLRESVTADRARRDLKELLASSKAFPEADEARALLKRLPQ